MSPVVERAGPADVAAIEAIARSAYAPYVARMGREPAPMNADHAAAIADGCVLVARDDRAPSAPSALSALSALSASSDHGLRRGDASNRPAADRAGRGGVVPDGGGRVVGYALIRKRADALHLKSVAIDPERAGRGIGRALIAHVERLALAEGHGIVDLYTNAAMHENLALYPALGYVETDRRVEDGFERVFFEKRLPDR